MKFNHVLIISIIAFADILTCSLILPIMPYSAGSLRATQVIGGLLLASYAAVRLAGAALGTLLGPDRLPAFAAAQGQGHIAGLSTRRIVFRSRPVVLTGETEPCHA